ncbi:MAG: alpha/beta hydrolase [Acidobacteria bacterium]|nr:alpha/beta hydrolase [Acidobacteriota bacterium]
MNTPLIPTLALSMLLALPAPAAGGGAAPVKVERKTCKADDGVTLVYSVCGKGEPALVFIHGGLADRSFWDAQLQAFGARHRVIALDLAGHGESGTDRKHWSLPAFGGDVRAVIRAEKVKKAILFGNSMGGPAAVEAALLLPGVVTGVVGVDTFHRVDERITAEEVQARASAFQKDFAGSVKAMTRMLFPPDADPALVAETERRMAKTSPDALHALFLGMAGYDMGAAVRRLTVPLRVINGDLFPTDTAANRKVKPDFEAVIMPHTGHYPMLERPGEFNRLVADAVKALTKP